MNKEIIRQVRLRLDQAEHILITSHTRPDGDAIGSILALGQALVAIGKDVQMVLGDGVPGVFRCLPGHDQIVKKPTGEFDLVVIVDCGDIDRVGPVLNGFDKINVNIDHHPTNTNFADFSRTTKRPYRAVQELRCANGYDILA